METEHRIPAMTHELGQYWDQPSRDGISVTDSLATMSRTTFKKLGAYNCSIPSGVYVGKMWKCRFRDGWRLRWYDRIEGEDMLIESRTIRMTLTEMEFIEVVVEWAREWLSQQRYREADRKVTKRKTKNRFR